MKKCYKIFFCLIFSICSQKHGDRASVPLPRALPLGDLVRDLGRLPLRAAKVLEAQGHHGGSDRRHPVLHRRHRPLRLHGEDLQQEAEEEAGER